MPMFEFECINGHISERYAHYVEDRDAETVVCDECSNTMSPVISKVSAMLYFEEGRGRRFDNLNTLDENNNEIPCPELKSWKDYERQKKKAGVEEAGSQRGEKGNWV